MYRPPLSPDPLLSSHPLPLMQVFYPFGQAVELSTDSADVISAAEALWARYPRLSGNSAVRLRISVAPLDAECHPSRPVVRGQEHLVTFVHGPENFAVADLAQYFAFACLTQDVARDHAWFAYHFLEPLAYLLLGASHLTILHAACVALNDRAVLLAGDSGAGKTCLAYACARRGWTFLSGDAVQFARGDQQGAVLGRPFSLRFRESARELFPELGRYEPGRRLNGKLDIEPPIQDLQISTGLQAHATHVVFLAFSPGHKAELTRLSHAVAFARLERTFFYGDLRLRAEQRASLERFLDPLRIFEMVYSDPREAEQCLRSVVGQ